MTKSVGGVDNGTIWNLQEVLSIESYLRAKLSLGVDLTCVDVLLVDIISDASVGGKGAGRVP